MESNDNEHEALNNRRGSFWHIWSDSDEVKENEGDGWNIGRRMSTLSFIGRAQPVVMRSVSFEEIVEESRWWNPMTWRGTGVVEVESNGEILSAGIVEDELNKLQRKEIVNQIKCLSYGIPSSKNWAVFRSDDDLKYPEIILSGVSGCNKPVRVKEVPVSMFEIYERNLKKTDTALIHNESLVLPEIENNYRVNTLRSEARIRLSQYVRGFTPQRHLYLQNMKNAQKSYKRAFVLSIHGFLPQKIVRNIIGESSLNSELMTKKVVSEMKRWGDINNVDINFQTLSVEGYGKREDRVNEIIEIIKDWDEEIKKCEYFVCVSNGMNCSISLKVLRFLVDEGLLSNEIQDKLGFISLGGAYYGALESIESKISNRGNVGQDAEIISEMFGMSESEVFEDFEILLKENFKVSLVGSLNDCFVGIHSSLLLDIDHCNIYRNIFIDGKENLSDFLISLIELIVIVKNLKYKDYQLLNEISQYFQGNVGEGGHFTMMEDKNSYRNGIKFMMDTSNSIYDETLKKVEFRNECNDYHIPWSLRGFVEEVIGLKRIEAAETLKGLHEEYLVWEPVEGKMKELKVCMEGFAGVLSEL